MAIPKVVVDYNWSADGVGKIGLCPKNQAAGLFQGDGRVSGRWHGCGH